MMNLRKLRRHYEKKQLELYRQKLRQPLGKPLPEQKPSYLENGDCRVGQLNLDNFTFSQSVRFATAFENAQREMDICHNMNRQAHKATACGQ